MELSNLRDNLLRF